MRFIILFFSLISARASTVIDGEIYTNATQALVRVIAPTASTCSLQVSENASFTPLHDDVNPALFTNANLESDHTATSWVSGSNTVRVLRLFFRRSQFAFDGLWHSRAGANNQLYYLSVTCDTTVTTTFTTKAPQGTIPEFPPIDVNAFGQMAFPEYSDFT